MKRMNKENEMFSWRYKRKQLNGYEIREMIDRHELKKQREKIDISSPL